MKWKELFTRIKYVSRFFELRRLQYPNYWRYIWMRAFVHRNLWLYPHELRRLQNKKSTLRKKKMYGTTASLTKKYGWRLVKRDGPICRGCKKFCPLKSPEFSVDHIVPASKGGETTLSNLQIMHKKCNNEKADDDYRPFLMKEAPKNLALKDAFEKAGITPASIASLSQRRAPQSEISSQTAASPASNRQSQS